MLQTTLPYKKVSDFVNERFENPIIEKLDWDLAEAFHKFLEVFYNATETLLGV